MAYPARRSLLIGVSALAIAALYPMSAQATPTTVNYTVNYAGDYTDIQTAFNAIGPDLTYSDSAHTCPSTGSSTTIAVNVAVTASCVGHTILWSGTRYLITSYNAGTHVATIGAKAGYPATFASTPQAGDAYTIDQASVTLTIGQSAAGSNKWTTPSTLSLTSGAVVTSATCTLTLQGATAYSSGQPLRINSGGSLLAPVYILLPDGNPSFNCTVDYITVNDLQFDGPGNSNGLVQISADHAVVSRCWFVSNTREYALSIGAATGTGNVVMNNSICGPEVGRVNTYRVTFNNCLFFPPSYGDLTVLSAGGTNFNGCAFYDTIGGGNTYTGSGTGYPYGASLTRSAAVRNIGTGTVVIATPGFVTATAPYDLRIVGGGAILASGGARFLTTDIFGTARDATNSTPGPVETPLFVPALKAVSWDVNYAGAITDVAPNGTVSVYSWSGGTATVTLGTHGLTVGGVYQIAICNASNSSGYFGLFNATVLNSTQVTYAVASSPTPPANPAQWVCYLFNTLLGVCGGAADLTYFQSGLTCSGTAADSSHIVLDASTAASVIGHPVQYQSGNICIIGNYDPITHIATVISPPTGSGFFASFGTTPQSGQAFTIFPMSVEFAIGQSAAGNTLWNKTILGGLAGSFGNSGAINFGPVTTSPASFVKLRGTTAYSKTVAPGTPANNGSAIVIKNNSDHTAVIGVACDNLIISQIQIYCSGNNQEDGCLLALSGAGSVAMTNVVLRGDSGTDDQAHTPWFGQSSFSFSTVAATNCYFVATDKRNLTGGTAGGGFTAKFCMLISTCNTSTTVSTTVASGTTIVVASNAGITAGDVTHAGSYLIHPNISDGANVLSISGSGPYTLTMQGGSITGSISAGAAIQLDSMEWANLQTVGSPTMTSASTVFLGMGRPVKAAPTAATYATCATDSISATGISGLTNSISYAAAITAGTGLFATGTVDCRLPPASPLIGAGTYDAAVPLDIFGQTRPNPPAAGPAEPVAAVANDNLSMGIAL